jgi:hypothetical protein
VGVGAGGGGGGGAGVVNLPLEQEKNVVWQHLLKCHCRYIDGCRIFYRSLAAFYSANIFASTYLLVY